MALTLNGSGTITGASTLATTVVSPTLTTPVVTTTIAVGGTTPANTGSGVSFPATQSASSDANTLDDYEEGTWTCTIDGQSSTATGIYTKIGNLVHVACNFSCNTNAATSSAMALNGLPFTSASTATGAAPVYITSGVSAGTGNNVASFATGTSVIINIEGAATVAYFRSTSTSTNPYYYQSLFKSTTVITFQFSYRAA
jgi:hypothetical protein